MQKYQIYSHFHRQQSMFFFLYMYLKLEKKIFREIIMRKKSLKNSSMVTVHKF